MITKEEALTNCMKQAQIMLEKRIYDSSGPTIEETIKQIKELTPTYFTIDGNGAAYVWFSKKEPIFNEDLEDGFYSYYSIDSEYNNIIEDKGFNLQVHFKPKKPMLIKL